jgi:protein-tyrosine phosphatase
MVDSTILFICTGNYYRSRFAEALFNHHAADRRLPWRAISRGLAIERVTERDGLSRFTADALSRRGIEHRHTSLDKTALTSQDLIDAALIIALCEVEHRPMINGAHPAWADEVIYWNVPDLPHWQPDEALSEIECQVLLLLNLLVGREFSTAPGNLPLESFVSAENGAAQRLAPR